MNEAEIIQYIATTFPASRSVEADGSFFFFHPADDKFPFATLVTKDAYDTESDLSRPGVFRLNIGVSKATFQTLFPSATEAVDFAALDRLLPHPVYGKMYWLCVLNPSDATFARVATLLDEAYALVAKRRGEAV